MEILRIELYKNFTKQFVDKAKHLYNNKPSQKLIKIGGKK
jgi:hypothetical protein